MKRFLTTSLLLTTTFVTMAVFIIKTSLITETGQVAGEKVTVSFFIGAEGRFSIFGYTSPAALVSLDAIGSHDDTYANSDGFFVFYNRSAPLFPQESCLTAQDQLGRLSNPICLAPFPNDYYVEVGPIILPPTTSLDKNNYYIGDEVLLTGQTIPNTNVSLSMFTQEVQNSKFKVQNYLFDKLKILSLSKDNSKLIIFNFELQFSTFHFKLLTQTKLSYHI